MEVGEMKRNTSNWSNFCMLLRRAGLTASAGLSCQHCVPCRRFLRYAGYPHTRRPIAVVRLP